MVKKSYEVLRYKKYKSGKCIIRSKSDKSALTPDENRTILKGISL